MLPINAMLNHTFAGDVCFDGFLGSGTTLIAAHQLGRICMGIEISPDYTAVCLQRFFDAFGIKGERISESDKPAEPAQ